LAVNNTITGNFIFSTTNLENCKFFDRDDLTNLGIDLSSQGTTGNQICSDLGYKRSFASSLRGEILKLVVVIFNTKILL